jgi:serine/threonine-protein kinase
MEGSVVADRYVINGVIGSGGMAIVYRGYDRESGEEVAIKVLRSEYMKDEAYVRRFEKESQIAIKYSHKNIVKTIQVGQQDGRHYIVMEYVLGMTLKECIAKYGRLKPSEVVRIGRQICDALFYAHSHQLIHRDVKPQNILLGEGGVVKVADFGIAKAPETATVTISGSNVLGSVHYISPEQARGGVTDEKADIYSIGIVLYEMVTGAVPFTGDTPVAVALKHLQDAPKPPRELVPDIPKALELVILKAISKEQSARYDNAREMARDLERSILEPEGSYVKIKPPEETNEGTRPMHALKPEGLQNGLASPQNGNYNYGNTGPSRRPPAPTRVDTNWRRPRKTRAAVNVLLYILLAAALLGGAYLGISALIDSAAQSGIKLRNYVGMDVNIATQQLKAADIPYTTQPKISDAAKDTVIGQEPKEGEVLPPGGTLVLTVSSGRQQVEVPDLTGKTYAESQELLKNVGLDINNARYEDSTLPKDTVVRQDPPPHSFLEVEGKVNIWLARSSEDSAQKMPNVYGLTQDDAQSRIIARGVDASRIKIEKRASNLVAGFVDGQSPDADTPIDSNTQVTLYVSNGELPGYIKNYSKPYTVTADNTAVKVVFYDGDMQTVYLEETKGAGSYTFTATLQSATPGQKTIKIFYNGKEVYKEGITFTESDKASNKTQ